MTLGISIIGFYTSFDPKSEVTDVLLVFVTALVMKTCIGRLELLFKSILSGEFPTPEIAIHFPILLKSYTSKYTGLILVRDAFPEESLYLYNSFDPQLDDASTQKDSAAQRAHKEEFYTKIIDKLLSAKGKFLKSEVFLLYLARIYMKKLENASKALSVIEKCKLLSTSIPISNSLESLQSNLQENYFKAFGYSSEELELANYFIYREDFSLLKEAMQMEIALHLDFWQEISVDNVRVKQVIDISNKIDEIYLRIRNRWRRKSAKFSSIYPSSLLMYGLYLDSIRGLPQESMPIIQRFYNYNKNNGYKSKMGTLSDTTAIIIASIEKDKLGMVVDASNTVESVFNIPKENMVGDKINTLMPSFIAKNHDWFLEKYMKSSSHQRLDRKINSYGKVQNKDYIIELEINLKLYPHLDKGVNIMAHMKQINIDDRSFIVKTDGNLVGSTSKMIEMGYDFNINFKNTNAMEKYNEFDRINNAYNLIYGIFEAKTRVQEEDDVSFTKENKMFTEDIMPTKENQNLFTHLDTDNDRMLQTLQTKMDFSQTGGNVSPIKQRNDKNDENPLFIADSLANQSDRVKTQSNSNPFSSTKMAKTSGGYDTRISTYQQTKTRNPVTEEEAKDICDQFQNGATLRLPLPQNNLAIETKKQELVIDMRIDPYLLGGEVYKICRVIDMQIEDEKLRTNSGVGVTRTLSPFGGDDKSSEQLSAVNFTLKSQGSDVSDADVPEERSVDMNNKQMMNTQSTVSKFKQTRATFKVFHDSDDNTSAIKKRGNSMLLGTREEERQQLDLDVRQSLTGKGASSTKSHSRMDLKLIKTLNDFFGEEKIRLITRVSVYGVYLIMAGVLILAFVNFFFTQQSLNEIDGGVSIVNTASSRLTSALRAWQWILLIYARMAGLRPLSALAAVIQNKAYAESLNMETLNNELLTDINEFGSNEILNIIFETKIALYDPTTQVMLTGGPLDSFTVNHILSQNNYVIGTWRGTDAALKKRAEPLMTINNTANNFLVSSETQISDIIGGLQQIIKKNERLLGIILVFENLALFVLCGSLLVVARVVTSTYSRTFQALVRLTSDSVDDRVFRIKKFQSSLFENIEAKSFVNNLNLYFSFFEENADKKFKKSKTKEKKMRMFTRSYTNKGLILHMAKYLMLSFIFIIIISGLFEVLYIESINSFNKLSSINSQLTVTNKLSYQSSLVLSSFYFWLIFSQNSTMLIRNEPPQQQVEENLSAFGGVNQELLDTLFTGDSTDPIIQALLQNDMCKYLAAELANNCSVSTQGDTLGLLGFNLKYYTISANYINMFIQDSSTTNAKVIAQAYFNDVTTDITILDAAYTFLTNYILANFQSEVSNLERLNLLLSLGAVFFILIATVMIQRITIKTLITLDNSQKKLFRVLTFPVFSQNKSVAFILKKEFGNEVEGINRLLNV
jgi:hypothetical protein